MPKSARAQLQMAMAMSKQLEEQKQAEEHWAAQKKAKDAKPGTPEHAADDFVAKMLAGDTKSAAKMVSSRARTPALKELLDGKAAKSSGQWKQVLQGANRLGAARSVRSDRVVNFSNSKQESIRMTLRRQGYE